MKILVLQETDWLTRGPHTQHHIFERLSKNLLINVTVLDYDIDKILKSESRFIKKQIYNHIDRAIKNSNVKIIRTAHLQIPFVRRISSLITNFFEILKIVRKNRPDVIVGFSMTNGLIGLILSKLFKIPYIFFYIDFLHKLVPISYVQDIARVVERILLKYVDYVLVHTKLQRNYVIREGTLPQNVEILPDGISLENISVDEKKFNMLKSKYSIKDNEFIIFFMGYLYEFAGLQEIIDYYNDDVKSGKIDLRFLILGDGGIYNHLISHVKKIGADWVILAGRIPFFEIIEYIQLADLCLMSFRINEITREVVPIKIFEYMAMKKPVLSNSLPAVILEIGKKNEVIFAKNLEDLIRKIKDFVPKKNELKKIGQKGYEFVKKNYNWTKLVKDFKKKMIDVIKKRNNNKGN